MNSLVPSRTLSAGGRRGSYPDKMRTRDHLGVSLSREEFRRAEMFLASSAAASPAECITEGYLAAIKGAASVIAHRRHLLPSRPRTRNAWELLLAVAPELSRWVDLFEGFSRLRGDLIAGSPRTVTPSDASEFYRMVSEFLDIVEGYLLEENIAA